MPGFNGGSKNDEPERGFSETIEMLPVTIGFPYEKRSLTYDCGTVPV